MEKRIITFNAVVETEVKIEKELELTSEELDDLLINSTSYDEKTGMIEVDEVTEESSYELNEMLLGIVPDELKKNCVSMTFTDIRVIRQK
ncbi:MAG TPA: hypothetical protein VIK29_07100 [Paludibacter sp.]